MSDIQYIDILRQGDSSLIDDNAYNIMARVNKNREFARAAGQANLPEEAYVEQIPVTEGLTMKIKKEITRAR